MNNILSHPIILIVATGIGLIALLAFIGGRANRSRVGTRVASPENTLIDCPPVWNPTNEELLTRLKGTLATLRPELSLNVATLENTELFFAEEARSFLGISLGTNSVTLSVRAAFRYAVQLRGEWILTRHGNHCVVICPVPEPLLPVAFDSASLEAFVQRGWARGPGSVRNLTDTLQASITSTLQARSLDPRRINLAKGAGRNAVRELVKHAFNLTGDFAANRIAQFQIYFADEKPALTGMRHSILSTLAVRPTVMIENNH